MCDFSQHSLKGGFLSRWPSSAAAPVHMKCMDGGCVDVESVASEDCSPFGTPPSRAALKAMSVADMLKLASRLPPVASLSSQSTGTSQADLF